MLLIHCPNCEHDNTPGERFCAKCGVPLNLKPCPQCGKVDQLTATVCSGCGATFPPIAVAHPDSDTTPPLPADPQAAPDPGLARPPHTQGAWPLILMAIAAGGIPLLWMNRAYIPLPKAWNIKAPSAAVSAVAPVARPVPVAEPQTVLPAVGAPPADTPPAAAPVAIKETPQLAAPPAKHARTSHKPATRTEPPRPCTEALAALGLCQPEATRK
jgi:hypothetical protein